jgi:hypothetical protein
MSVRIDHRFEPGEAKEIDRRPEPPRTPRRATPGAGAPGSQKSFRPLAQPLK